MDQMDGEVIFFQEMLKNTGLQGSTLSSPCMTTGTAQVGLKCLSCTPGSHSACAVRTPLGVDRKILSIRREPMLSRFLSLNA